MGIIPRDRLPWPLKNQTSPEIVNLVWRVHDENPAWGRWRIAQTLWRLLLFLSPSTIRNILKRPRPKKRPFWKPKKPLINFHIDINLAILYYYSVSERLPCSRMRVRDSNPALHGRGFSFINTISLLIFCALIYKSVFRTSLLDTCPALNKITFFLFLFKNSNK